jgi:polyhydroxyalkanoate synthesis repressor PhaR
VARAGNDRPPHLIRRYGNRKLYDPQARRYVTLEDVARLVAGGEDVAVADQRSGEDLTSLTLAQALLEGMKQSTSRIPCHVLTRLIRLSAGPAAGWGDWPEPRETAGRARDEVERIVGRLLGRGRLSLDDAVLLRQELGHLVHELVSEAQSGVEARLRALLRRGDGAAGRSLDALRGRLRAFESYLQRRPAPPGRRAARQRRRPRKGPRR